MSSIDVFCKKLDKVINLVIRSTKSYNAKLLGTNPPNTQNSLFRLFHTITNDVNNSYLGLGFLQGMVKIQVPM